MWTLKAFQSYAQHRSDVEGVGNRNLDEWRAINQGEFHNFQCNIFPSLGYTNTHIHSTTTACDKISTGLVECEHVKAKIAQMAHPACGRSFLPRAEKRVSSPKNFRWAPICTTIWYWSSYRREKAAGNRQQEYFGFQFVLLQPICCDEIMIIDLFFVALLSFVCFVLTDSSSLVTRLKAECRRSDGE